MIVLFVAVGIVAILYGCTLFIKVAFKLMKAVILFMYYSLFASVKTVDEAFKKHVISKSPEFEKHNKTVDAMIEDMLKS
jgi:hypothetical protein